jgi:hypothetical protein
MVKMLLMGSDTDRRKKIQNLEKELGKQNQRIKNLLDLFIDGSLSTEDYNVMRHRFSSEKSSIELKLYEIKTVKSGIASSLEKGVGFLSNLGRMYAKADLTDKKRILSSIFSENLVFDGIKCRTPRINEVLRLILLIDNNKQKTKSGQIPEFLDLSAQVELAGVIRFAH